MTTMNRSIALMLFAALTLAACGGGGGGGSTPPPPPPPPPAWEGQLITNPSVSPITAFRQTVVSDGTSSYYEIFPGQANAWTLDADLGLIDGFGNQFFYALQMTVGGLTGSLFPIDQDYSELTFYTPYLTATDGIKAAAVSDGSSVGFSLLDPTITNVKTGTYAAFINATSDSRLQQVVSLPTTTPISLSWKDAVSPDEGAIPGYGPSYRVAIRDLSGSLLRSVETTTSNHRQDHDPGTILVLNQFAGQTIVLSFEFRSSTSSLATPPYGQFSMTSQTYAIIDDVSITANATEYVTNGTFESGNLTGWTTNSPAEIQNMTSGSRNLEGLDVQRSFYTSPNKLWGRWVDVYENKTGSDITKTVVYETALGYNGAGIIYSSSTGTKSLTAWDNATGSRDIGWVFGNTNAGSVVFTSDDGTGTWGSDFIDVSYNITVPAGGRVAIVNFILMDGRATGNVAPLGNLTKKATAIDAVAADILSNFWNDTQYITGMTQQQVDAIKNF